MHVFNAVAFGVQGRAIPVTIVVVAPRGLLAVQYWARLQKLLSGSTAESYTLYWV